MPPSTARWAAAPARHGFGADFSASMSAMFDDLFGEFMGARRRPRQRSARERGADLRYNMEITLAEAYEGKTAQIRVPTSVTCDACSGSGAKAARRRPPAGLVAASARCARARASSPSNAPVRTARDAARQSRRPARPAIGARPRHARAHALGHHPDRGRGRDAHQARRRGRGRSARRTARRSLHLPLDQAA